MPDTVNMMNKLGAFKWATQRALHDETMLLPVLAAPGTTHGRSHEDHHIPPCAYVPTAFPKKVFSPRLEVVNGSAAPDMTALGRAVFGSALAGSEDSEWHLAYAAVDCNRGPSPSFSAHSAILAQTHRIRQGGRDSNV